MAMPIRVALVIATGLLASAVAAQGPGAQEEPLLKELLDKNRETSGYQRESDQPGAPLTTIWGDLAGRAPGGSIETAQGFVDRYGTLLGFQPGSDLGRDLTVLSKSATDPGEILTLVPSSNGVPYLGGAIVLEFSEAGSLESISGRYRPLTGAQHGRLDGAQAARLALAELSRRSPGKGITSDGTVQEIFEAENDGQIHHHYLVDLVIGAPPEQWRVVLGAAGNVISVHRSSATAVADGTVCADYPTLDVKTRELPQLDRPKGPGRPWKLSGSRVVSKTSFSMPAASVDGHFKFPTFLPSPNPALATEYNKKCFPGLRLAVPQFLETNCYYHLMRAHDKATGWGAKEVDVPRPPKFDGKLRYDVWVPPSCRPAGCDMSTISYVGFTPADYHIRYSKCNPERLNHAGLDPSTTYHEYGHFVQAVLNPQFNVPTAKDADAWTKELTETAAVGEGWADYFAVSITGDPVLSKLYLDASSPERRSLAADSHEPYKYTYSTVTPCYLGCDPSSKGCAPNGRVPHDGRMEIHEAGQAFSNACWEIRQKLGSVDEAMKIVMAALRKAKPATFRNVGAAIASSGRKRQKEILPILKKRGLLR